MQVYFLTYEVVFIHIPEKPGMTGHGLEDPADEDDDLVVSEARGQHLPEGALHAGVHILQHPVENNFCIYCKIKHRFR